MNPLSIRPDHLKRLRETCLALPEATEKIDEKKKNILNIWVDRDGSIYMNDQPYQLEQISDVVAPLYVASDQFLVISVRADRDVPYARMDLVQKELQQAGVARVVFATELEQRMSGVRR